MSKRPAATITLACFATAAWGAHRRRIFPLVETVVGLGDWVNVSVMLRGIKRRVERPRPA